VGTLAQHQTIFATQGCRLNHIFPTPQHRVMIHVAEHCPGGKTLPPELTRGYISPTLQCQLIPLKMPFTCTAPS